MGVPINGWFIREKIPWTMDDLGYPHHLWKPPFGYLWDGWWSTQILDIIRSISSIYNGNLQICHNKNHAFPVTSQRARRSAQRERHAQGGHGAGHALHEQRPLRGRGLQGGASPTGQRGSSTPGGQIASVNPWFLSGSNIFSRCLVFCWRTDGGVR